MKFLVRMLFFMILGVVILSSCDLLDGSGDSPKYDYKNLVAFIARFEERNENGEVIDRPYKAVVADFYNTSNYEIVAANYIFQWSPRFSRDKTKILIYGGEVVSSLPPAQAVILHDLETIESEQLQICINDNCSILIARDIVWNYDGSGFYNSSLSYYSLRAKSSNRVNDSILRAWGLKGQDTLLVTKDDLTNAYLDLTGNVIGNIDNPYFEYSNEGGRIRKAAFGKDWNDELGLVVYKEFNQGTWKLSITNLDGSYYRSLAEITPTDSNPVWGPENRYILYVQGGNILVYDLETDETRYFVTSEIIEGATAFMCPEF